MKYTVVTTMHTKLTYVVEADSMEDAENNFYDGELVYEDIKSESVVDVQEGEPE